MMKSSVAQGLGAVLAAVLLAMPVFAIAGPSPKSVAVIAACAVDASTARVCSSKELSNVILRCRAADGGTFFHKFDDLDEVLLENPHDANFSCPDGATLVAVFAKSGSAKYDGPEVSGLPSGAGGVFLNLAACGLEVACVGGALETDPPGDPDPDPDPPPILN